MSLIKILKRTLSKKKKALFFVLNAEAVPSKVNDAWDSITNKGAIESLNLDIDIKGINLYNVLRGYLDEKGVKYKQQGNISQNYLLRLEDKDMHALGQFLNMIREYKRLENTIHGIGEETKIMDLRIYMKRLSSKYNNL
ncbi:hypothetical protein DRN69_04875 [Candidatus Pacearchaeota archaeon]|nr:MAG: hypothetical protein DRN69_04875 [Candidatus Pacearchaeota archaeon]